MKARILYKEPNFKSNNYLKCNVANIKNIALIFFGKFGFNEIQTMCCILNKVIETTKVVKKSFNLINQT